jgi:hypothetical protein
MNRAISILFSALLLSACASPPPPKSAALDGKQTELTASSRDTSRRPFRLKLDSGQSPTLAEDEALRMVDRALRADGFGGQNLAAGLEIKVKFQKEKPLLGLGSYKQEVVMQAIEASELRWEISLAAPSNEEDIRPLLPSILAAGLGFYGKNSGGKKLVPLPPRDTAESLLAEKPGRRGLLQR